MSEQGILRARVTGVGLWSPGFGSVDAWKAGEADPELKAVKAKVLDRQCSRRASPFAKAMAAAFDEATKQAAVDVTEIATVFGSALGETHIMIKLLDQIRAGADDLSPMLFAVSVHNAASGLVSISTKNRAFTTSVAADYDTPAMALMEAMTASLDFGVPAVVVCGDESSPEGLVPDLQTFETLAGAIVVDARPHSTPALAELSALAMQPADAGSADAPPRLVRNPQAGLLDLIDAVARGRYGRVALDRGEGTGWTVEVREAA